MILRLSSSKIRVIILAFAFVCAVLLSYFSIRYEHAVRLEPKNSGNWQRLGRYWQYNLEDLDTARAIQAYTVALSLNPRSADTWAATATAYEAGGNIPVARDAFLHAKNAYPLSPDISWRYGNFLLRQGETDAAFLEIRRAVELEPQRGAEALSRALRTEPNLDLVLDRALPPMKDA